MSNTKNNHFVPQYYLKKFLNEDAYIFKCDLNKNFQIYKTNNLKKECCQNNLYSVKNKITMEEIELFCRLLGYNDEPELDFCKQLCKYLNGDFSNFIECSMNIPREHEQSFKQFLKTILDNNDISRTQENIFTSVYENDFFDILDDILRKKSIEEITNKSIFPNVCLYLYVKVHAFLLKSFLQIANSKVKNRFPSFVPNEKIKSDVASMKFNTDTYIDLIHYAVIQFFRSQKQINNLKNIMKKYGEILPIKEDNFAFILLHLKSIYLTEFLRNTNYNLILIENKTSANFITSDSPCINLCATYMNPADLKSNDFDLYLPLSPKYALLFTSKEEYKEVRNSKATINAPKDILPFNIAIQKAASRYVYSCNEKDLMCANA